MESSESGFLKYSLSLKIDAPKIDAFSENSRDFQNYKFFGEFCQNSQFLVKIIFRVTLSISHSPDFDQKSR